MSELLGRPVRFREVAGPAHEATLVGRGVSEAFAQDLVKMFRAIAGGFTPPI